MVRGGGRVDNTALEARPDVLTYSTDPLDRDVEVIGEVSAEIWFRSSLRFADVFVRLCDVDSGGRSVNVCDGLVGLTGADEVTCAAVRLWPTAHRFKAGHRIRVQVSSGAFSPLWAQPRHRRGARHRDHPPPRQPGGLPRPRAPLGHHPARAAGAVAVGRRPARGAVRTIDTSGNRIIPWTRLEFAGRGVLDDLCDHGALRRCQGQDLRG